MRFAEYDDLYMQILELTAGPDDEAFDLLPASAQAIYVVAILDMEVQNGGLLQFFTNCDSSYATKVAESLRAVGLEEMAVLYESFLAEHHIALNDLSAFQVASLEDFSALYSAYPFFNDFDDAYMALWESLDFNGRMLDFAEAHPEALVQQP